MLVAARPRVPQGRGAACGGEVARVEVVLDRERDAGQRTCPGLRPVGEGDECAQVGDLPRRLDALCYHLRGGRGGDAVTNLVEAPGLQGGHAAAFRRPGMADATPAGPEGVLPVPGTAGTPTPP